MQAEAASEELPVMGQFELSPISFHWLGISKRSITELPAVLHNVVTCECPPGTIPPIRSGSKNSSSKRAERLFRCDRTAVPETFG